MPALGLPLTEIVKVEVEVPPAGTDTVPGLNDSVKPEIGLAAITTFPEKLLRLAIVIVEVPGVEEKTLIEVGFAEMLKSGTVTVKGTLVE